MINADRTNQIKLEESNRNILVKLEESMKGMKEANHDIKAELNNKLQRIESKRIKTVLI